MTELPIDLSLAEIMSALEGRSAVVVAPPGSGKTTRVPPAIVQSGLLSAEHPVVVVLQPRRVAARAAAARIADERGWKLGAEVGYHVRFDRRFSARTPLRFVTEGILTNQLLADPFLEGVGAVVLDEFHERNLNSDLALALLQEVRREVRPDLIVVVMSATLDAGPVARYLGDCPIIQSRGQSYAVMLEYRPASRPASAETLAPLIEELLESPRDRGHLLVFLPGMGEIKRLQKRIEGTAARANALVLPLHGSLPPAEQDLALAPSERRKVILATNVAETSLTIDGVSTVVDSGLARIVRYDAERGIDRWDVARISRAAADQRAGRAGRTGPGRCIRLWSEREQRGLAAFEQAEIHRVDLCATVLALHAWGAVEPSRFLWYEPPAVERLEAAGRLLTMLGGLAGTPARITPLGNEMLELPVHPRLGRLLVAARHEGRAREGAEVAALLSDRDIRSRERSTTAGQGPTGSARASGVSDVLDRLDMLTEAEASRFGPSLRSRGIDPGAARQIAFLRDDLLRRDGRKVRGGTLRDPRDDEAVLRWLLLAYPDRVVKRRGSGRTGVMVGGRGVRLGPESALGDADFYLALDAREDRRIGPLEAQVGLASAIQVGWLEEFFAPAIRRERLVHYDDARHRVISVRRVWYHDLLLREGPGPEVDRFLAGQILAEALRPQAADLLASDPEAAVWLARWDFVIRALPELGWHGFDDALLAEVLAAACAGKIGRDELGGTHFVPFLQGRLTPQQARELSASAPPELTVPSGRAVRLTYDVGRPPILAVRLQELFGWTETPRLARGRIPVLLHLLGPNNRPVQITDDLKSFWTTTYHAVRKDLRGRYPKHPWPEDPLSAKALVRGKPK
jgi:ATP-dependent helicase HrpB